MEKKTEHETAKLTKQEIKVIQLMRSLEYGELRIVINGSKPTRVEEIKRSVQL